jgi:hypothetical protein
MHSLLPAAQPPCLAQLLLSALAQLVLAPLLLLQLHESRRAAAVTAKQAANATPLAAMLSPASWGGGLTKLSTS